MAAAVGTEAHAVMELQWGRDLSVAEWCYDGAEVGGHDQLQWGRDLSVAEWVYGARFD